MKFYNIQFEESIWKQIKVKAAQEGLTIKKLIENLINTWLEDQK